MDTQTLLSFIQEYSYIALFLIYAVGLFVFPVPNEVLLMTGGFLATTRYLSPIPTFFVILLSIFVHGTLLYLLGWKGGKPLLGRAKQHAFFDKRVQRGEAFLNRYGLKAAAFSYFLPFLRHATPFSVGLSKFRYAQFAMVAFASATIWSSIYFFIGYYFSAYTKQIGNVIEQYGVFVVLFVLIIGIYYSIRAGKNRTEKKSNIKHS
ncbi:DedA family protein [Halalkalibacterium ligniniphilum]|uniref:DedA family protein n=1 Tax=Halalkalibacterium ligniniphilum TaxID=1134413 RepID=UPI00034AE1D6|nr:DedA family protein [Halalkalibacterium ligniniphilum]